MFFSRIVFFAAALLVAKISADTNSQWQQFEDWMENVIKQMEEKAEEVSNDIQQWAAEEEQKIQNMTQNIANAIEEEIASLKEQAEKVGANVSVCFQNMGDGGIAAAKNITMGAVKCLTDEIDEAKQIVSSLVGEVQKVNLTFVEAKEQWNECDSKGSSWKIAMCRGTVVANATIQEGKCAVESAALIAQAEKLITTAEATMQACVAVDLATAPVKLASLLKDLAQCVVSKISGQ